MTFTIIMIVSVVIVLGIAAAFGFAINSGRKNLIQRADALL
ncbi:hypothetical protein [Thalassobacillus cyri]|nr:hypothetical protein [Thalassobacillus cyri]